MATALKVDFDDRLLLVERSLLALDPKNAATDFEGQVVAAVVDDRTQDGNAELGSCRRDRRLGYGPFAITVHSERMFA
jgi:hypothetical protein